MTEGWVDCPSLGPGWQRREVMRKNGTRPGHSDTYYISPRGEKIRSRVELSRLLGCSRDLTDFNFRRGVFVEPNAKPVPPPLPPAGGGSQKIKKGSKRRRSPGAEATPPPKKHPDMQVLEEPLDQKPLELKLELPVEAPVIIPTQPQEPLAPVETQPMEKPCKRRNRKHHTPVLAPGKMGEAAVQETNSEETIVCASCQGQFPGVMLPSQRRCRWLCPDCRAQRRDFNREQRYYKRIGCGVCQACQMSQDCGICRVCVLRTKSPELRIGIKCLLRRCLKIVKKGLECGMCQACKITEDCGSCCICLRRQKPGMKRQWKCLKRRCLKRKKKIPPKKDGCNSKKLTVEAAPAKDAFTPVRRRQKQPALATDGPPPKAQGAQKRRHKRPSASPPPASTDGPLPKAQLSSGPRRRRKRSATTKWKPTVECENTGGISAVKHRKKQLGTVKEKKKVGRPPKHPATKVKSSAVEESPSGSELLDLSKARNPEMPEPQQQLKSKEQPEKVDPVLVEEAVKEQPILPQRIKEELEVPRHPTPPTHALVKESSTRLPAVNLLIATSPKVKQEPAEPGGDRRPSNDSPVSAGLPQFKRARGTQGREVVVLDDEEDDDMEQLQQIRPPVIMEIYSLRDVQPLSQLDSVLREFLAELNEIPLPAHWEVLPPLGSPNLRLVQRSKHSTMSAAVIHIRPGLFFHVVVRDLPVPLEHELYASHPARLTTVDEVVELICDLEAYRLCPGWPAGWHAGERSQACDVLVYSGCCPQCRLNPWPSGSGTR
ncbi:methyl-CpG-binding domain protein 1-like isoform X7 [Tiliqua scincoides]|uniref:methyl-CpG-binding domain protein 1-like isoform X7 n=1 Tax=Tiliqua scincoides TaxID=71010 RepID=UPI00346195EF